MARKISMPLTVVFILSAALTLGTPAFEESNLCSGIDEECDQATLLQLSLQQQPKQSVMTNGIKHSGDDSVALARHYQRQSTARTSLLSGEVGGVLAELYYYTSKPPTAGNFDASQLTPNVTRVDTSINFPHRVLLDNRINFCIRFTGGLRIHTPGNYTMSLISDDGSILMIDGAKVVDNDGWHGMRKASGDVELAAGDHPLEVIFVQGAHGAGIVLRYSGPDTGDAEWVVPSNALVTPSGVQLPTTATATRLPSIGEVGGLLAEFFYETPTSSVSVFDDLAGQSPDVSRVDTTINYSPVSHAWTGLATNENYCVKWSGGLRIEVPGTYRLRLESDDGSVLLLDGDKVVDNDGYHAMRTVIEDVELVAGDHPIEVRYFEGGGGAGMIFMYAGPDTFGEFIVVPPTALVAPAGVQPPTPDLGPPARTGLLARRSDMRTDFRVPRSDLITNHNECNFNTPDGRLFFCGEMNRYVRYFKFESLSYTANGMPIFNDSTWSLWPERLYIPNPNEATGCIPDWKRPFEVLHDGSHFYSFFATNVRHRVQINVTIANPMTPQAEIVSLVQGDPEGWASELPLYHYFTTDGKMVVGEGGYTALPESGEPCSLNGWHPIRPLTSAYADADGLKLPARYPFARWRLYQGGGEPWLDEAGSQFGRYYWIDLDARNLWYERSGKWHVMGEDTYGMEYTIDGPMNLWERSERVRFMSSTLWNYESERTAAQRFPGELHTSGVGSGCSYQLPMSKAHHVLPVFDAKAEFYTEVELVSVWKSPHWDIFFLPMVKALSDAALVPDMSRHFLNGRLVGNYMISWAMNWLPAGRPHGQGAHLVVHGEGGLVVNLSSATDVMGVTSSTRAFTAQLSFMSYSWSSSARPLLVHPNISIWHADDAITWTFNGESINGGSYVSNERWYHLALVFDGVDQTVTTFNNGFEVTTVATGLTSFQLDKNFPVIFGHSVSENLDNSGHHGLIDNPRFMHHARAQKAICGNAWGSSCRDAVTHHPTTTQFSLSMQIKECSVATMHTLACSSAIHRVCANLDAQKGKEAGVSNDQLAALTPPGPPVSMAGVPVSIGDETVAVACSPNTDHLSIPVDWWIMEKYESHCSHMSDHSSLALYCNLAAHGFCKDAFTDINPDSATGIIFEADARAWVSCFAADEVLSEDIANVPACSSDLTGLDCQLEVAALCTAHDGGVLQASADGTLLVHCFNAPPSLGLHNFTL